MNWFSCLWLLWLLPGAAHAQPHQAPTDFAARQMDGPGEIPLQNRLFHLTDSTGKLTIHQVIDRQRAGLFQKQKSLTTRQDFGYNTTATHWLFFALDTPLTIPQQRQLMLEIEYANLDELQLIEVSNGQIKSLGLTGDRFQFRQRPYQSNNYVFPIRLRAGQQAQYYLRVKQSHAILSFSMQLWHRPAFLASDRTEYFLWGVYIGIICIVLVLNMVMLVALRDWIYVWYSLYLHLITMHLFSDAGLGFQYLWPTLPTINEFSPVYLYVWAAMVAQLTFMQYFIHQNSRKSRAFRWVNAFKVFVTGALLGAIAIQLLDLPGHERYMYKVASVGTSCFVPVFVLLMLISLYERRRERDPMVRYYGYALAVQFTGYVLVTAINFCQARGWPLPFDVETYVVLGLSVLTDLAFFTYGLAYRYTHAQQHNQQLALSLLHNRQNAQQQVIDSLKDERQRLAQDLHDDIGPLLATAKGYLSRLARATPADPLQKAQTLLDEAANELRTLSHQLLPGHADQTDLTSAIAETARKLSGGGVPVRFVSAGQVKPLDPQREQLLFSLATQLIRNARQHEQATEVTVQLLYHDEQLNLSVEDNGLPANMPEADLVSLRTKTELLKAELLIDATDDGNSLMVSLPITNTVPA
ncbi:MAG TPA: 7TM-DISM domain-containing protein [Fibrella sp.]